MFCYIQFLLILAILCIVFKMSFELFSFGSKETKVQLSSVILNAGSSYTSRLHHAAQVQPQRDQSCVPEVHPPPTRWVHMSALAPKMTPTFYKRLLLMTLTRQLVPRRI